MFWGIQAMHLATAAKAAAKAAAESWALMLCLPDVAGVVLAL